MAGLIIDGTILYQPVLVRAYFPGYSLPLVEQNWDAKYVNMLLSIKVKIRPFW